jgi:hypothetical protein
MLHELAHQVAQEHVLNYRDHPRWFREGVADYAGLLALETIFDTSLDHLLAENPLPRCHKFWSERSTKDSKWLPLATVTSDEKIFDDPKKVGSAYAESLCLLRYLDRPDDQERRSKFRVLLRDAAHMKGVLVSRNVSRGVRSLIPNAATIDDEVGRFAGNQLSTPWSLLDGDSWLESDGAIAVQATLSGRGNVQNMLKAQLPFDVDAEIDLGTADHADLRINAGQIIQFVVEKTEVMVSRKRTPNGKATTLWRARRPQGKSRVHLQARIDGNDVTGAFDDKKFSMPFAAETTKAMVLGSVSGMSTFNITAPRVVATSSSGPPALR